MNPSQIRQRRLGLVGALSLVGAMTVPAGEVLYTFDTDPNAILEIYTSNNDYPWQETGGNPGGFLGVTYSRNSQYGAFAFPDIDDGKIVTAFRFEADLRVGNPTGERGADGFSVSFARSSDPLLVEGALSNTANFAGGIPEGGSTTGIAVSFDTWAGNTLPDGADIEGILVRVDNVTVLRQSLPTRNGACDDPTSLQTGPRDPQYWTDGGDPYLPEAWDTLCWQKLVVDLDDQAKLTVSWKGSTVLDALQTSYFPTPGRIILAGRTGDANEHTHFDNIKLTTTATAADTEKPTTPPGATAEVGARRVALTWGAATDNSGRVAYKVYRDTAVLANLLIDTRFEDLSVVPGRSYNYRVVATDVSGNESDPANVPVTTVAEVSSPGWLVGEIYDGISGTTVADLLASEKWPASPDRTRYLNGLSFGFGGASGPEFGDNYGMRIAGVLTAPESGQFRFFIRSDDASEFYLNPAGPALPVPGSDLPIAQETDCCDAFQEPDVANDDGATFATSEPVSLVAGQRYGFVYLVKEGGGGDNGEVAWRREGETTPANQLTPIRGAVFAGGMGDAVGASITLSNAPVATTVVAYQPVTLSAAAVATSPYNSPISYQWYKNGTAIRGANAATYTMTVTQPSENGARYSVSASVPGASVTSPEVVLTVTENQPAKVVSVEGSETFTEATIRFDQPVTSPSATTPANYVADNGLTVSAATLVDAYTVRLTTSRQAEAGAYNIAVNNVQNLGGTPVPAGTVAKLDAWRLLPSRARLDQFNDLTGTVMSALIDSEKYPDSPDVVRYIGGLTFGQPAFGDTYGENYGAAVKAILRPTVSGQYRFFVRSDDSSQLFINTSGAAIPDARSTSPIAQENGCCGPFEEPGAGGNTDDGTFPTSEPVSLTAGQSYGVLFLVKEGGGGDWGQVAWRREGDTTAASSLQPLTDMVYWYGPAPIVDLEIESVSLTGGNVVITYAAGVLQSADSVDGPYADVAGATSPYTTPATGAKFYRLRGN